MPETGKKTNPWPFLAISLLVILLTTFLVLKFTRKDKVPAAVKPTPGEVKNDPRRTGEIADPAKERDRLIADARKAIQEGKTEEAEKAIAEARRILPGRDLEELEADVAESRKEKEKEKETKQETGGFEKILDQLREEVKKKTEADLYDEAVKLCDEAAKKHPGLEKEADYKTIRSKAEDNRSEIAKRFGQLVQKAKDAFKEKRFPDAFRSLSDARKIYPEHGADLNPLEKEIRDAMASASMVRVAEGEVVIGSDEKDDEKPVRKYKGKGFWIDVHEVTNEEYRAFISATGHRPPPIWRNGEIPKGHEKHPVVAVTLSDAEAYAKWAGKRLPTAEEWEMAARWIDGRKYPWGDSWNSRENVLRANSLEYWQLHRNEQPGTLPVGRFASKDDPDANGASPYGVWDMAGNVWEWTSTPLEIGADGKKTVFNVIKGGSFMTPRDALRCANRALEEPDMAQQDLGFRCVKD